MHGNKNSLDLILQILENYDEINMPSGLIFIGQIFCYRLPATFFVGP